MIMDHMIMEHMIMEHVIMEHMIMEHMIMEHMIMEHILEPFPYHQSCFDQESLALACLQSIHRCLGGRERWLL